MFPFAPTWPAEADFVPLLHRKGTRPVRRERPIRRRLLSDELALVSARRLQAMLNDERMGGTTTQWTEVLFVNGADYSAVASTASETSLLGGVNQQPSFPAFYFDGQKGVRRTVMLIAQGVLGTTSTPTIIFQTRLGTSAGSSSLTGASIGVSAAITTASGVSNKMWYMQLLLTNYTPGIGSGNDTISGAGFVWSGGGFASPFQYVLEPTTPDTATWTQTFDASVTTYVNLSVTWSASSASNTITAKNVMMLGMN